MTDHKKLFARLSECVDNEGLPSTIEELASVARSHKLPDPEGSSSDTLEQLALKLDELSVWAHEQGL